MRRVSAMLMTCAIAGCIPAPVPKPSADDGDVASAGDGDAVETTDATDATDAIETTDATDATDATETVTPDTTPSPLALERVESETHWQIHNQRFGIGLDEVAGWMPQSLTIAGGSGLELLYGTLPSAIHEVWIGLSLFDEVHLWNDVSAPELVEDGPAIVRTRRTSNLAPIATTIGMTLHADGRLVIAEDVTVASPQAQNTLVTYVVLDIARFSHAQADAMAWTLPTGQTTAGGVRFLTQLAGITEAGFLCARHVSNRDTVGFIERGLEGLAEPLPRITEHAGGATTPHSIRLQYDLARDHTPAGFHAGRFLVTFDASGNCSRVGDHGAAFRTPPTWTLTTGTTITDQPGDDDGDGFVEAGGYYAFGAATRALTVALDAALPAVTLRLFGPGWATPSVNVDGVPLLASEVVTQPARAGDGGWVVIARPLAAGASVSVSW